jgi:transposase
MYIDRVPNRSSRPTVLLREGTRQGKKVKKTTLLNLTHWPTSWVDALERALKGETLVSIDDVFAIERSLPHGHVEAILEMARKLDLESLISSTPCRERDLVMGMIVQRLIEPSSKLAVTRHWRNSTLADTFRVEETEVEDLYDAMNWLLRRQKRIEKKLAKRHLSDGTLVLYDVSSSSYHGKTCPLAAFGYNRDGIKGLKSIVYGVLTDSEGRPISVQVYKGNTADPTTVLDQVDKLRQDYSLSRVVLVGDRGMLTEARIGQLKTHPELGWISALRTEQIRDLVKSGDVDRSLFDETNLAEIRSVAFPGERLVVCLNPFLADERGRTRDELLEATEKAFLRIQSEVRRRTRKILTEGEIGLRVGKVIGRHKMRKHFELTIKDGLFEWKRNEQSIEAEKALDGIYVIRTSEPKERLSAEDTVRSYKNLARVENNFRTLKGIDVRVRPIHHRLEDRVRAHFFLCMLTYYLEWHLRKAWASLLFDDEEVEFNRKTRHPVAPAQPSQSARRKRARRVNANGFPVQNLRTLLRNLATRCHNTCRLKQESGSPTVTRITEPSPLQAEALRLIHVFPAS